MFFRYLMLPCLLLQFASGCQSLASFSGMKSLGLHPSSNRENPQDAHSDPWIQDAGAVTRSEHSAETVNDPLHLREVFMSNKARDIERNLGVGD